VGFFNQWYSFIFAQTFSFIPTGIFSRWMYPLLLGRRAETLLWMVSQAPKEKSSKKLKQQVEVSACCFGFLFA